MLYHARGSESDALSGEDLRNGLVEALDKLGLRGNVLAVPPDFTRMHSRAGDLTRYAYQYYGEHLAHILPATGTHFPMTDGEIGEMFGDIPRGLFRIHDWREGLVTLGEVPCEYVRDQSGGAVDFAWPAQVDKLLVEGNFDLILSIGQVVPHEVIGMANYNKNLFVGTGGSEGIGKSHFLGAAYGMERIMGRADNPVRRVLNYASDNFAQALPVVYVQTVVGAGPDGKLVTRGMYIGDDVECFTKAAELSLKVNFTMLDRQIRKAVVYLDPGEFKSTWLGNKSIYRTRMALADGAELIVLAPGVREFGEDPGIDKLIRTYGYCGTEKVLDLVRTREDLAASLGAAAHLIHGSTEGRFSVTYCPGDLSKQEIEKACFKFGDLNQNMRTYDPAVMAPGWNTMPNGEEIFFVHNPAIGLWAHASRFLD